MDLKGKGERIQMPAISKIRFTNAIYDNGEKRYNDEIFEFDGHNGVILLENGGGKTTFIQIALQAILPHVDLGGRKIRDTLLLEGNPCHIAIEWIINDNPRRYALTAVTLYLNNGKLDSYRYVYEYGDGDKNSIENIPFTKDAINGNKRSSSREEMGDYYHSMARKYINAKTFSTIKEYHNYIEENFKIIPQEWRRIGIINGEEGGIRKFFENCKTTDNLVDRLLIPVVEEAMEGKGTEDFVNTFEEQREHFKKHRYLKELIDESRQIQDKIKRYVNIYSQYKDEEEKFNHKKSYAKGLYQYISKEEEDRIIKLEENSREQEDYKDQLKELNRMVRSYELATLESKLNSSKERFEEALKSYEVQKGELDSREARLQNLKIARINKQIQISKDELLLYEGQLKRLEKDEEISKLERELFENSARINGYFQTEINRLNKDIETIENDKKRYEELLEEYRQKRKKLEKKYEEISESYIRKDQEKRSKEKNMEDIRRGVLSNPATERIEEEYPKWANKVADIERYLIESQEKIKSLHNEKDELKLQLQNHRDELSRFSTERDTLAGEIKYIEELEYEILEIIKENIPNLYHINSIYTKQEQILGTLENRYEILRKEREKLLIEERKVHRFIDDYRDNTYFTAEPLLSKWIEQWKDQFSFLESGSKYIERIAAADEKVREYFEEYPYWAMTVVVADDEELKLKDRLKKNLDKISHPIIILSYSKANEVLKNGSVGIDDNILYPPMWKANIIRRNFQRNKDEFQKIADKVTLDRKDIENRLNKLDYIHSKTIEFLNRYPFMEHLRPLKDRFKNVEEKIFDLKETITRKDKRIFDIDDELATINKEIQQFIGEKDGLNKRIEKAMEYIREKREVSIIENVIFQLKNQKGKKKKELSTLLESIDKVEKKISQYHIKINNIQNKKNNLLEMEIYKEVKDISPLEPNKSLEILKIERKDIKDRLDKRQRNRRDIEDNIRRIKDIIEDYKIDLNNEIKGAKFSIEEIEYPHYGDKEIEELIEEINRLNPIVKEMEFKKDRAKDEFNKDQINYNNRVEDFFKEYDSIIKFTESLRIVKENIHEKKRQLDTRYRYLKSMEDRLKMEYDSIKEALKLLVMKNERYEYLADKVEASLLPENIQAEIPYNRIEYVNSLIKELEEIGHKLGEKRKRVSNERVNFEQFCNNSISDPRLKNMAISGINHKDDFVELTKWKKIMDRNIDNSIRMLEEDLIEHDRQINQFVSHMNSYLKTLTEEIRYIPKKTRIKVEDRWKEIYIIHVPSWEDEVGKQKLIDYINYLLKEIEDIRFKDEDGKENKEYIRKFIENRFQGKELLKIVMGNQKIKVKCRKVTNDGRVNSIPVSWDKSNNWSGGERWSKNMTLFLGILNYLAEKSQGIQSSQKRNRTVILDNPFGEASSDHVLEPVFFIAEKLGFQIIALTALSEGKYIRDYFPVVYSCRLRPSKNNETQILTKEKEINYAFLRDNDPTSLLKLGDVEQLSMI